MTRALFTLLLGSSLVVLPLFAALGNESAAGPILRPAPRPALPLPPVPHLDTIPWLTSAVDFRSRPNVDVRLTPRLDSLAPFLIDPVIPPNQFSAIARASDSAFE
jgi:hypothetical protein